MLIFPNKKICIIKNIFSYILLCFFLNHINSEIIIFPFKTINTKKNSSYDFMSTLYTNEIYTNIKLGKPQQKDIPTKINNEEVAFSINNNFYDIKNSPDYNASTFPRGRSFPWENIPDGVIWKDKLNLNISNKTEDVIINSKFIYVENQSSSYIGLSFPDLYELNAISIFKTLKDNKLIGNYQWCPRIKKNNKKISDWSNVEGELVIGGNCNDYLPGIYESKNMKSFEMVSHGQYVEYSLKFPNLYIGDDPDKNSLYYDNIYFGLNFLTTGSYEYENKIANLFFNDYLDKNICFTEPLDIDQAIHYYYCKISSDAEKKFDIKSFPKLCMGDSESSFCFDYNDLFVQDPNDKNIFYFLIGFKKYDASDSHKYFRFGLLFLSKFQLSFDPKNKIIYYFGINEENEKESDNNKNKNEEKKGKKIAMYIVVIASACIILVILGMLIQKQLTKIPRKIRANELNDDEFLYEQKNE